MKLSGKELVVLDLLRDGREAYGLWLVDAAEGNLKRGTVYVTLSRMEEKGLVESWREPRRPGVPGIPRRLYRATGVGVAALRESGYHAGRVGQLGVTALKGQA